MYVCHFDFALRNLHGKPMIFLTSSITDYASLITGKAILREELAMKLLKQLS